MTSPSKMLPWALGALVSRIVALRQGVTTHPFSRFDGIPTLKLPRGSTITIGKRVRIFPRVRFTLEDPAARITIGERTFLNRECEIVAAERVSVGADCAISWRVLITDTDFHQLDGGVKVSPVSIGDRVWIGAGSIILKGVTIGNGAVIAAGSVVTKSVPERTLVAGNPAIVVRTEVEWKL